MTQVLMRVWLAASSFDLSERLRRDEGQTVVEYALILGVVVLAAVGIFVTIGGQIGTKLGAISNALK